LSVKFDSTRNKIGDLRFVRISYYQRDAFDVCELLRGALRVAAGD